MSAGVALLACTPGPSHFSVTAHTFDRQAFLSPFLIREITTSLENWI